MTPDLRPQVLVELRQGHLGVVKIEALVRSYVWWPGIDKEIEETAKTCFGCQLMQAESSTGNGNGHRRLGSESRLISPSPSLAECF